jgi:hypothetical protein
MKHKAKQIEVRWNKPEAFSLIVDTTMDGDRIAQKQQQKKDRQEAEEKQVALI